MQLEGPHLDKAEAVVVPVHLNMAAAQLKMGDYDTAIFNCTQVRLHVDVSVWAVGLEAGTCTCTHGCTCTKTVTHICNISLTRHSHRARCSCEIGTTPKLSSGEVGRDRRLDRQRAQSKIWNLR